MEQWPIFHMDAITKKWGWQMGYGQHMSAPSLNHSQFLITGIKRYSCGGNWDNHPFSSENKSCLEMVHRTQMGGILFVFFRSAKTKNKSNDSCAFLIMPAAMSCDLVSPFIPLKGWVPNAVDTWKFGMFGMTSLENHRAHLAKRITKRMSNSRGWIPAPVPPK